MRFRALTDRELESIAASRLTCARCSAPPTEMLLPGGLRLCASHAELTRLNAERQEHGQEVMQAAEWDRQRAALGHG